MSFFISDAVAQQSAPPPGGGFEVLLFPILLIAIFYFLMIRPQTKRAKEHKQMVESLKKGDEVVTSGGVLGRITDVGENFIRLEVGDLEESEGPLSKKGSGDKVSVHLKIQKNAIASLMPKGTIKEL